jgi:NodT family efflux transporter outer membrane factor (OMF) lipoprotein
MNINKNISKGLVATAIMLIATACSLPTNLVHQNVNKSIPATYSGLNDTVNSAKLTRRVFFTDPYLIALIDTALQINQELAIMLQEINISKNEVRARKGEYLPFVGVQGGAGIEKVGKYSRPGAVEQNLEVAPGKKFPEPLPDLGIGAFASWELDIWKKLRNSKKAAMMRYLSSVEGKNFMVTHLVAEIANSYYELMALDNQLEILGRNIEIQKNALEIVRLEKTTARVTELAVRKFEAEVLKNQSLQYYIKQNIVEIENRINFLVGRYPQSIQRNSQTFSALVPHAIAEGLPSQLLTNRPDIRQAEFELAATQLDVKAAKANFYPSVRLTAGTGYQAFNASYLLKTPQSMLYSLAGELIAPLVNRNAIKAYYYSANSKQIQAVFNYDRTVLNAYTEVVNQLSYIHNLEQSYNLKTQQVQALTESIDISTRLFKSARADYMEVLLTQRDALEAKFELVETKKQQMNATVNVYKALGGGWN